MKFKKYIKESTTENTSVDSTKLTLSEDLGDPDMIPAAIRDDLYGIYGPVEKLIKEGDYAKAVAELQALTADVEQMEADNAKRRFFKWPASIIEGQRKRIQTLMSQIPAVYLEESLKDMDKRCEHCNTLLNDMGTCPKCDEGEEDIEVIEESSCVESLSNKEKLKRAYPELNFDAPIHEDLSVREKLKAAYPELNFETTVTEETETQTSAECESEELCESEDDDWYDDDYDIEDDVELDRRHAALYGGDRMYCDCGAKKRYNEYGPYCPVCDPVDPEDVYDDANDADYIDDM